jgi:hypothetical protein
MIVVALLIGIERLFAVVVARNAKQESNKSKTHDKPRKRE